MKKFLLVVVLLGWALPADAWTVHGVMWKSMKATGHEVVMMGKGLKKCAVALVKHL